MNTALPVPHLLTCPPRAASLAATLASWENTGWQGRLHIHTDPAPETPAAPWGSAARHHRIDAAILFLLRRHAARTVLGKWDTETGVKSQRLAKLLTDPILVRSPSLVQQTATDSCWGTAINRALDFHPDREL